MNDSQSSDAAQAAETPAQPSSDLSTWQRRLEIAAAILLAVTTVATAWSAYQASRWGGLMSIRFNEAGAARTQESQQRSRANSLTTIDVTVFVQYAEAISEDNAALSAFLYERFRPEMKAAVDAWLATEPLTNAGAPPSPFDMPEYRLAASEEADRLLALAEERSADARRANQQSDDYVLLTVIFASTLFFAGISNKFRKPAVTVFLLVIAWALFLGSAGTMLTYPVY